MINRPQSLQTFKTMNHYNINPQPVYDIRKKIQNYTFLPSQKIGRGYSSIVYKGQNQITKQPVAIKVIQLKTLKDENTKRFLQNQLECLRRLQHPNLLRYINSFMTSNNCYIITELYNGGDLGKTLKQKKVQSQSQLFQIFNQFYQGYKHFNSRGFIHRDIKPSNILIQTKNNQKPLYVIADFGFIKHLQENPKDSFNVGTPVYMAPQSISSNIYTVKSDIWSMGVMLFEMAYGFLPFQCKNQADLRRQICNKQLRLQQIQDSRQKYMSIQFKTLLLSCLRKNPQNRISLQQIGNHSWFKKYLPSRDIQRHQISHDLQIHNHFKPLQPALYRRPLIQFNTNTDNSIQNMSSNDYKSSPKQQEQKYGYIGNQAIKRQKSLQSNQFSLKNYSNNTKKITFNNKDCEISVEKHKQKAKQLGILTYTSDNRYSTDNKQNINIKFKQPQPYFVQNYLKDKLTSTNPNISIAPNNSSPKLVIQKKLEPRSSLLEGMKGIINIKNSQILKINNDSKTKPLQRRKPSFGKLTLNDNYPKALLQISTSIDQNKCDSAQSSKSKNLINLSLNDTNDKLRIHSNQSVTLSPGLNNNTCYTQSNNTQPNKSNLQNIQTLQNKIKNGSKDLYDPCFTQPCVSSPTKREITPNQFFLKSLYMLRYIHQNLTLIQDYNGEVQKFNEPKECLEQFFITYLQKLRKSITSKQNKFQLKKWRQFCQSDKYTTHKQVLQKYYSKYESSSVIGNRINENCQQRDHQFTIQKYQKANYSLLKLAEQLGSANKQLPKKSLRNSSSFNASITLILNIHKCMQMIIKFTQSKKQPNILLDIEPDKQLQEMNSKSKDPFKIPKIIIQLKKKLISLQSGSFIQGSQIFAQEFYNRQEDNSYRRVGRISLQ